jgi:hypothetical protein
VQPETNEIIPTPEVQAQAADLIETAQAEDVLILPAPPELEFQPTSSPLKDGKKPDYYRTLPDGTIVEITRAEYKKGMHDGFTVRHRPLPCGHKLVAGQSPRHRNCEACWFTFFQVHGELTQAVDEAYNSQGIEVGRELIKQLRGTKFLKNFLKFMASVATLKAQMETQPANV